MLVFSIFAVAALITAAHLWNYLMLHASAWHRPQT